jgi:hypothetical protein
MIDGLDDDEAERVGVRARICTKLCRFTDLFSRKAGDFQ